MIKNFKSPVDTLMAQCVLLMWHIFENWPVASTNCHTVIPSEYMRWKWLSLSECAWFSISQVSHECDLNQSTIVVTFSKHFWLHFHRNNFAQGNMYRIMRTPKQNLFANIFLCSSQQQQKQRNYTPHFYISVKYISQVAI